MTPAVAIQCMQVAIGLGLVGYALYLLGLEARKIQWRLPRWIISPDSPADDLRVLIEMAARFRDAGNAAAVHACQELIDELLNPKPVAIAEPPKAQTP